MTKSGGTEAVAGMIVVLENGGSPGAEAATDVNGNYALSVNTGTYDRLRARNTGSRIAGIPPTVEHTAFTNLSITTATVKDIVLPRYYGIHGIVSTSAGTAVANAKKKQ
jgi:hypothetical protein